MIPRSSLHLGSSSSASQCCLSGGHTSTRGWGSMRTSRKSGACSEEGPQSPPFGNPGGTGPTTGQHFFAGDRA